MAAQSEALESRITGLLGVRIGMFCNGKRRVTAKGKENMHSGAQRWIEWVEAAVEKANALSFF